MRCVHSKRQWPAGVLARAKPRLGGLQADSRYFEGACWVANYGIDAAASSDEEDDDDDEAEAESCAGACFAFAPDVDERECDWPDGACATAEEPPLPLAPFWYGCEDTHHVRLSAA
jgi:hypothetical protein